MAFGAAQPPFGRLPRLGPGTITSLADLLAEVEQVRRVGFATTWEELEEGSRLHRRARSRRPGNRHRGNLGVGPHGTHVPRAPRRAVRPRRRSGRGAVRTHPAVERRK